MSVTQYIGSRYVPLFAEPLDWDKTREYEALTIVYYGGNSYTSRQAVPKGIDISNNEYWALTGNYNAQIEQYRAETEANKAQIGQCRADIEANKAQIEQCSSEIEANKADVQTTRKKKFTKAVTFGDSWERGFYDSTEHIGEGWLTNAAALLGVDTSGSVIADGEGYSTGNVLNMSVSGTGFGINENFLQRIKKVTDAQWEGVDLILVGGGINDTAVDSARNNAVQMVQYICSSVLPKCSPNCEVHFFAGNGRVQLSFDQLQIACAINKALQYAQGYTGSLHPGQSIAVHTTTPYVMRWFARDHEHPEHLTKSGYIDCGAWVASKVMSGGDGCDFSVDRVTNIAGGIVADENVIFITDGMIHFNFAVHSANGIAKNAIVAAIDYHPPYVLHFPGFEVSPSGAIQPTEPVAANTVLPIHFSFPINLMS